MEAGAGLSAYLWAPKTGRSVLTTGRTVIDPRSGAEALGARLHSPLGSLPGGTPASGRVPGLATPWPVRFAVAEPWRSSRLLWRFGRVPGAAGLLHRA